MDYQLLALIALIIAVVIAGRLCGAPLLRLASSAGI